MYMATRRIRRRQTKRNNRKRNSRKRQTGGINFNQIGKIANKYNERKYISVYEKYVKQNNGVPTNDTELHGIIPIKSIDTYNKDYTSAHFYKENIMYKRALFVIECAKIYIFPDPAPTAPLNPAPLNSALLNPAPTAPLNSGPTAPLNSGLTAPLNQKSDNVVAV